MSSAIDPDHFKIVEIIPIYKNGEKFKTSNYRPISLLSNFAKIYKKILYNRLSKFFDDNKILSDKQYDFINDKG